MKIILVIIFLFFSINVFAQADTICFSEQEVLNISNSIKNLEQKDSLKTSLINELKFQIINFEILIIQDSLYIDLQKREINLRELEIVAYKELYNNSRLKWYDSKIIFYSLGVATILTSSYVVSNVK